MKQDQVTIGMQARVKIGSRLAEVTVLRQLDGGGSRGRTKFECRTSDTGRIVKATAARLRPMPTPRVDQLVRQMVAAAVARADADALVLKPAAGLEEWASCPVGAY